MTLVIADGAASDAPRLSWPVDCTFGVDCWIRKYVDLDPSPGRRDYACGVVTTDKHSGTDIGLRSEAQIADRVAVLAAAPGTVVGVRDEMVDRNILDRRDRDLKGKDCGNGVRLDHGDGWSTQYCHLKRGSIAVKNGQRVARGQHLGTIGLSGSTEFPHLHMTLRHNNKVVDPFVGEGRRPATACGPGRAPQWTAATMARLSYAVPALIDLGVVGHRPDQVEARRGWLDGETVAPAAPVMIGWVRGFGLKPGDQVILSLKRPDGRTLAAKTITVKRPYLKFFRYIGAKRSGAAWAPGRYRLEAAVVRPAGADGPGRRQSYRAEAMVAPPRR